MRSCKRHFRNRVIRNDNLRAVVKVAVELPERQPCFLQERKIIPQNMEKGIAN